MSDDAMQAFRDSARDLLSRSDTLARLRNLRGSRPGFDRAVWVELADAGWFGVLVPEEDGGLGLGLREICAISEQVGQFLLPEPYIAGAVQAACALVASDPGARRAALLEQLVAGELVAGLAWQDTLGQVNAGLGDAHARFEGDACVVSGTKRFVTPAEGADGWIVLVDLEGSPALVWIAATTPGVQLASQHCVDGSLTCDLILDGVRVARPDVLAVGATVLAAVDRANDCARIVQAAELLGVMRRLQTLTLEFLCTRKQFGRAIGSFQAIKHRAVDGYIQVELSSACLAEILNQAEEGSSLAPLASRAKARCAHAALFMGRMAIQFHGAMGYTDECDIGLYFKRAMHLSAWLGNASAHRSRYLHARAPETADEASAEFSTFPQDADWDAMPEQQFRQMLRAFYRKHYPDAMRNLPRRLRWAEVRDWTMTLSRQGWLAPAWPKRFGGMGLPPDKMIAYVEEQEQYGIARAPDMGILMIGPLLIHHGTAAQQQKFLPKIIAGEHIWCQGYSEPNAGSDLASLRTEAIPDGGEFIVNGQKIWTTLAQDATHMFALVRTDREARKQAGISFLLIDLATPGITIRPIRDIGGHEEFCEVFLENVRVPADNLVGEINQGWTMAKTLLGFERIFLGSPKQSRYALSQLSALAEHRGLLGDPVFASRYAELLLDVEDQVAAYTHFADIVKRGETLPPGVSLLKLWGTDTYQRICTLLVELAEEHGSTGLNLEVAAEGLDVPAILFNAIPSTIYGGSTEIQKEIIAKNVLRLPD